MHYSANFYHTKRIDDIRKEGERRLKTKGKERKKRLVENRSNSFASGQAASLYDRSPLRWEHSPRCGRESFIRLGK